MSVDGKIPAHIPANSTSSSSILSSPSSPLPLFSSLFSSSPMLWTGALVVSISFAQPASANIFNAGSLVAALREGLSTWPGVQGLGMGIPKEEDIVGKSRNCGPQRTLLLLDRFLD
ncbi:hypothetical protein V1515DRAFT_606820 [Lipomyces mesembrius]